VERNFGGPEKRQTFFCHQTTYFTTEDGDQDFQKARICAGSIEWQTKRGIESDAKQIFERLEKMKLL
jgi:hypothetical protein